jgi:hypothetical protein
MITLDEINAQVKAKILNAVKLDKPWVKSMRITQDQLYSAMENAAECMLITLYQNNLLIPEFQAKYEVVERDC